MSACVDSGSPNIADEAQTENSFDFTAMMANYADSLLIPSYKAFENQSLAISEPNGAIPTWCARLGTAEEANALQNAQEAWREAMDGWQQIEAYLVGPIVDNGSALRNNIYSFFSASPLNSCAVDQAVVLNESVDFDVAVRSFNHRGLDTLEYLLFNESLEHTCPSAVIETQSWNMRDEDERKALRCAYAAVVASDLSASAAALVSAWEAGGGNFRSTFVNPENLSTYFETLSDALFYIELETKDAKLGIPTGLNSDCSQLTCASAIESPFSDSALDNVRANLEGFREVLTGGSGLGFDDILASEGFASVSTDMINNIEAALSLIDETTDSLSEQTASIEASGTDAQCINSAANPDSVQVVPACSLHGLLKRITDSLRTEFITIVNVDLPERAQSDND